MDPNSSWLESNTDPNYQYTPANELHLKLAGISSIFYFTLVSAAKLSILLLYRRLFIVTSSAYFMRLMYPLAIIIVLFWVAATLANIFSCWPVEWSWRSSMSPEPYCFNFNIFWLATGVIEAVLDVVLITLPIRVVWGLQMSTKRRTSLVAVFSLGIL